MEITRLRADANTATVQRALSDVDPERTKSNRYAILTTTGETPQSFLIAANRKTDSNIALLETATADKLVTIAVKEADGSESSVSGKLSPLVKLNPRWALAKRAVSAVSIVSGGWVGANVAVHGLLGNGAVNDVPATFIGALGLVAIVGAVSAFARMVKISDGVDWAQQTVKGALEGPSAEASVKAIEQAPTPVAALPPPSQVAFVIPVREVVPVSVG